MRQGVDDGVEDGEAVDAAHYLFAAAFGVGHHAEDVALFVGDAGDVVEGAVGVGGGGGFACGVAVAEEDLSVGFEAVEGGGVGVVAAFAVGDGDAEDLAGVAGVGEGGVGLFDAEVGPLAAELEVVVAHEDAGEESGFAEHLEAVADAEDEAAFGGEFFDGGHDGGEAGDGAGAEVVAVGEAAGEDDAVEVGEGIFFVPEVLGVLAEDVAEGVVAVGVAPGAGEDDDAEVFLAVGEGWCVWVRLWLLGCHGFMPGGVCAFLDEMGCGLRGWIPACAGMTGGGGNDGVVEGEGRRWIPAFAGMTVGVGARDSSLRSE